MEEKLGLIPRVGVRGWSPKSYAVLVTDQRFIFVYQAGNHAVLGGLLFGVVGVVAAHAYAQSTRPDFQAADPGFLALKRDSVVIAHHAVRGLGIGQGSFSFQLVIDYAGPRGEPLRFVCDLDPPDEQLKEWRRHGIVGREAQELYATQAKNILEAAMAYRSQAAAAWPPSQAQPGWGGWQPAAPQAAQPPPPMPEERGPRCPKCGERTLKDPRRIGYVCPECKSSVL